MLNCRDGGAEYPHIWTIQGNRSFLESYELCISCVVTLSHDLYYACDCVLYGVEEAKGRAVVGFNDYLRCYSILCEPPNYAHKCARRYGGNAKSVMVLKLQQQSIGTRAYCSECTLRHCGVHIPRAICMYQLVLIKIGSCCNTFMQYKGGKITLLIITWGPYSSMNLVLLWKENRGWSYINEKRQALPVK